MTNRRNFLGHAAVAATLATPLLARAATPLPTPAPAPLPLAAPASAAILPSGSRGPSVLRIQSSFPSNEMLTGFGEQWAKRVNELGGGDLKIEFLAVGSVVKGFEVHAATSDGRLDGAHTIPAYLHAKNPAISLWSAGPGFGMDARMLLAWNQHGGGKELLAKIYENLALNVVSRPYMPLPNQPLGWFKKEITKVEDLKGLKYRTSGMAQDVMTELGLEVIVVGGSEIGPLIESGKLDGGEFNNLTSDKDIGLNKYAKYCMLQSYSEATGCMELIFNSKVWNDLPPAHRMLIETIANAMTSEGPWEMAQKNSLDYQNLAASGTKFIRTPPTILQAQLNAWDRVISRYAGKDPLFATIIKSQKEFAQRASRWESDVTVDFRKVQNHYFNRRSI